MGRRKHEEGDAWRGSRAKLNEPCNQIRGVSRKIQIVVKGNPGDLCHYVKNEDLK